MNKKIKFVLLSMAICLGIILAGTKAYAASATTINDLTRVRKEASTNAIVIGILAKNHEVEVVSKEGDWYKIKYKFEDNTYIGYVRNDLLKVEGTKEENTTTEENNNTENSNTTESSEKTENNSTTESGEKSENKQSEEQNNTIKEEDIKENAQIQLNGEVELQLLPLIYSCQTGKIAAKSTFTVTEIIGNWCHIEAEGKDGWVMTGKLLNSKKAVKEEQKEDKKVEEKKEEEKTNEENKVEENKTVENKAQDSTSTTEETSKGSKLYVNVTTLNLREKAETGAKILVQLQKDNEVTVEEVVDNTWTKVKAGDITGYVASQYLTGVKPAVITARGSQEPRQDQTQNAENNNQQQTTNNTSNNTESNNSTDKVWKINTSTSETSTTSTTSKSTSSSSTSTKKQETKKQETKKQEAKKESSTSKKSSGTTGADIVAYAKKYLGYRYVYGGSGPNSFDCSGFTQYVYKHFGYSINRTASAQRRNGRKVKKSQLQPGDLVFFTGHVGIYIGGNEFIHAANPRKGVVITSLSNSYYVRNYAMACRIL